VTESDAEDAQIDDTSELEANGGMVTESEAEDAQIDDTSEPRRNRLVHESKGDLVSTAEAGGEGNVVQRQQTTGTGVQDCCSTQCSSGERQHQSFNTNSHYHELG